MLGHETKFKSELSPKWQIMLPKSTGSLIAEVTEIVSDTELKIKRGFGEESDKGTARVREKIAEEAQGGVLGLPFKCLPFIDQQEIYQFVYQRLKDGGCIGLFPEGISVCRFESKHFLTAL